jgi:predicted permease
MITLRRLSRDPASYGAAAVLAFGFGAAAAVFALVNALLLKPLSFPEPDRLVALRVAGPSWSPRLFDAVAREATGFAALAGVQEREATLRVGGSPLEPVRLESVSAAYFDILGVRAHAGRVFGVDEDRFGAAPAGLVVVAHGFATRHFGEASRAINQAIEIDGRRVAIAGVMPRTFRGIIGRTDVWSPLSAARWLEGTDGTPERPSSRWFEVIGRLRPGLTLEDAGARFEVEGRRAMVTIEGWQTIFGPNARSSIVPLARTRATSRLSTAALILLGGSGLMLLMATANLAGLQIARAATRRREVAIRVALGATSGAVTRLFAGEVGIVVTAGLAGAVVVRALLLQGVVSLPITSGRFGLASADPLGAEALRFDALSVAVLLATALVTWAALVAGPVMRARRFGLGRSGIREAAAVDAGGRQRARGAMLALQSTVATVLLSGAILMAQSAHALARHDRGYLADGLQTIRIESGLRGDDVASAAELYRRIVALTRPLPGVASVGVASCAPGVGRCRRSNVARVDGMPLGPHARPTVGVHFVSPGTFDAMGARLAAGRDFDDRDRVGAPPVAIVSSALAERLWPAASPIGRTVSLFFADGRLTEDRAVVGVVRAIEYDAVETTPPGDVYLPDQQAAWSSGVLFVRGERLDGLVRTLAPLVAASDPAVMLSDEAPMRARIGAGLVEERFVTVTLAVFAGAALILSALGAFALVRVALATRRRELAIRVALGATRGRLARDTLRLVAAPALLGVACGTVASAWGLGTLATFAHGVDPHGVGPIAVAALLFVTVTLAACVGPALRAAAPGRAWQLPTQN